jgi:hypothetical protein
MLHLYFPHMQSTAFMWVKSVTRQPTVNSLSSPLATSKQPHPESVMAGAIVSLFLTFTVDGGQT